MAATVLTTTGHEGKDYLIAGPERLSYADRAGKLSAALGRAIGYEHISPDDALSMLMATQLPYWVCEALVELFTMYDTGNLDPVTDVTAQISGHAARFYDDFLAGNLAMFK